MAVANVRPRLSKDILVRTPARIDLRRAHATVRDADFGAAAFWLQQSAEKTLKGWLIGCGWALVKTHDLERLRCRRAIRRSRGLV